MADLALDLSSSSMLISSDISRLLSDGTSEHLDFLDLAETLDLADLAEIELALPLSGSSDSSTPVSSAKMSPLSTAGLSENSDFSDKAETFDFVDSVELNEMQLDAVSSITSSAFSPSTLASSADSAEAFDSTDFVGVVLAGLSISSSRSGGTVDVFDIGLDIAVSSSRTK